MSATCRIWLSQSAEPLAGSSWARLQHAPDRSGLEHADVNAALREPDDGEPDAAFAKRLSEALDQLAMQHSHQSIALQLGPRALRTCIAVALDMPDPARITADVGARRACVIDWPTSPADRHALIGIDLDWLPPPPSGQRARFPGGPGSAPSTRG